MKSLSASMQTMLASRRHTRARCLWLALRDGTILGITDHDRDLEIDMPDISDVPIVYQAETGILPSNIQIRAGLTSSNFDIEGPLTNLITRTDILGHRYNHARARIFDANWSQDFPDQIPMLQGLVADVAIRGSRFVFEVRSDASRLNQTIGRVISPYCDADFGDERCMAVVPQFAAEVTSVTDSYRFTLDIAGVYADDFFASGKVDFTTGDLANIAPVEIFGFVGSSALVTTLIPLPEEPEVGDQLIIKRGCSKLKISDNADLPTCVSYDNAINFRGMDRVTGSDQYLRIPIPGEGVE